MKLCLELYGVFKTLKIKTEINLLPIMKVHSEKRQAEAHRKHLLKRKNSVSLIGFFCLFVFSYVSCPEETSLLEESPAAAEGQGSCRLSLVKW